MSASILKNIYESSFTSYLQTSKVLGDFIYQQSIQVDHLMKAFINLIELTLKYDKPRNVYVEEYLKLPIINGIHEVKNIALLDKDYENFHHLEYISESVDLFEWISEVNNIESFIETVMKGCQPSKETLEVAIRSLRDIHSKWFKAWQDTFDELTLVISSFYKNGLTWHGHRNYSASDMFGNVTAIYRMNDRQAVSDEISKGEEIVESLKQDWPQASMDLEHALKNLKEIDKNSQVFKKDEKKWRIEHQKGDHKSLVINSASADDLVFIYNCENCTILIGSEMDRVRMDRCSKVTILFRCTVVAIELVDNHDCQLHSFDKIEKIDMTCCQNITVFLTHKAFDVKVYSEKCVGIILHFPGKENQFNQFKICEKFVTTIVPYVGIKTSVVEQENPLMIGK